MANREINLTDEELKALTQYAELFFSIHQCALLLEKDPLEFKKLVNDENSPAGKAYLRGHLLSQTKLRKAVIKMAEAGSNPAQGMMRDFMQQALNDNLVRR